jgi:hypothetical protein
MTHTPAPWDVHIDRHGFVTLSAGPAYLKDTTDGFNIAGFLSPADAHLMRAAPDLLEALETVLNHPTSYLSAVTEGKVRTAIAKAKAKGE